MSEFIRKFDDIEIISKTKLFRLLREDIDKGDVFLAIRNNRIDFYYKGGKLFSYERGIFKTHKKYTAAVEFENDYISEENLKTAEIIKNFEKQYDRIKENCGLYSGVEGVGVWYLLRNASFVKNKNIVVLDTEVSLESLSQKEDKKQDRIDILLFNKKEKQLKFVEAKHYSNGELWAEEKSPPKVIGQLGRYNEQIDNKYGDIIKAYQNYVKIINKMFNFELPVPEGIHKGCALYVFGFDEDQSKGRFERLLKSDGSLEGVKYYARGNPGKIEIDSLYKKIIKQ